MQIDSQYELEIVMIFEIKHRPKTVGEDIIMMRKR